MSGNNSITEYDVIIIGAGASGLMCAIEAGKRQRSVLVIDRANKSGKKILMSGGGRCNFTNYDIDASNYISHNPHFCKSALSRYTQWDFLALVQQHGIAWHERDHGQLFCDHSAKDILNMLLQECRSVNVRIKLNSEITVVEQHADDTFVLQTAQQTLRCHSLVVATGGLSIPSMGGSPFGYRLAEQFGIRVWPTRAGLVPFTLHAEDKQLFSALSGIAIDAVVTHERASFRENILFTHRGLSGPAILQISNYWRPGDSITVNLLPDTDLSSLLMQRQQSQGKTRLRTILAEFLPRRLLDTLLAQQLLDRQLAQLSHADIHNVCQCLQHLQIRPNGTEGYRTAEVTLGGVDCDALSSRTMESRKIKGLYFIGEVVDVTGWLGGYNFQWAWASGWCAGQVV